MNIFSKRYEDRKEILYEMGDRSSLTGVKNMVRCECGKRFNEKGNDFCPECNKEINKEKIVFLRQRKYTYYNTTTRMFLDEIETEKGKDIVATISMLMVSVWRHTNTYYPVIGENAFRLKVRLNIKRKTALLYMQKVKYSNNDEWEEDKFSVPFINFTQPVKHHFKFWDIMLPDELIKDLSEIMGIENLDNEDYKDIDLSNLAWLNRIRDYKEAMRQKNILRILEEARPSNYESYDEDVKYYKKNLNRVKRYISSNYKPKNYDENIFNALCKALDIDRNVIQKKLEKHYYLNPEALRFVKEHNLFFHNKDIMKNAISIANKNVYGLNRWTSDDENLRETVLKAFKSEKNIYNKIKGYSDYSYLYDTARMINELKKSNVKVKTKGNLKDLHDKVSMMINELKAPKISFINVLDKENAIIDNIEFKYEKSPLELINLGRETNTCVGSYYEDCLRYGTSIVSLRNEDGAIGVLEIRGSTIWQAKGISNTLLKKKIQKAVSKFAIQESLEIFTRDINSKISDKNNDIIRKSKEKNETTEEVIDMLNPFVA